MSLFQQFIACLSRALRGGLADPDTDTNVTSAAHDVAAPKPVLSAQERRRLDAADRGFVGLEPLEPRLLLSAAPMGELFTDEPDAPSPPSAVIAELKRKGDSVSDDATVPSASPAPAGPVSGLSLPDGAAASSAVGKDYIRPEGRASHAGDGGTMLEETAAPLHPDAVGGVDVLHIRVDFPDMTGAPLSTTAAEQSFLNAGEFMRDSSWGDFWFEDVDVTQTYRMPELTSYYWTQGQAGAFAMEQHALSAVANDGIDVGDYWSYAITFDFVAGFGWAGLGYLDMAGIWLNGYGDTPAVVAHEFGHNLGAYHSSAWSVDDGNPLSSDGELIEYGDPFDVMGDAYTSYPDNHFNTYWKAQFGWLDADDNVLSPTEDGVYRLFAHDVGNGAFVADRDYAMRLPSNQGADYWLEYRQRIESHQGNSGLEVRLGPNAASDGNTMLVDTTGGDGATSAPLAVGETYEDAASNITITPVDTGVSGDGNWWIDVRLGDEVVVAFADANLEQAVRDELGIPSADITDHDMLALTALTADASDIGDLTGLEHAHNLQTLSLDDNDVDDLQPLAGLTALQTLSLEHNDIDDVTPLADLAELQDLRLTGNAVADASTFAELGQLQTLRLNNNAVSDLGPLSSLTQLQDLRLSSNDIADLEPLADLTGIETLALTDNQLSDISHLGALGQLDTLLLGSNELSRIDILADLTVLEELTLDANRLFEIAALADLDAIDSLDVRENYLDISTGSPPRQIIDDLESQGATVQYDPQRQMPAAVNVEAASLFSAGVTEHTIEVTFAGTHGLDVSTLTDNDQAVRVTGPEGFDSLAEFDSIDDNTDGTPRTVTYEIEGPAGGWQSEHNGTYTIELRENQVADTEGNFIPDGTIGAFDVLVDSVPPTSAHLLTGTTGNAPWYISPVAVELSATDDISGVDTIEYHLGDGSWVTYDGDPFTIEDEGTTTLHHRAIDHAGNVESTQTAEIHIDLTDPDVSHDLSGDAGNSPWFISPVAVDLSATDDISGVDTIEYHFGDGSWSTYSSSFNIDADGVTTVHYRATDVAGNIADVQSVEVHLDTAAPTSTPEPSGLQTQSPWFRSAVELELTATDATSGVDRIEYHFGDGSWSTYDGTALTIDDEGVTTIHHRAIDEAGHVEVTQTAEIYIDTVTPSSTHALSGDEGGGGWFRGPVEIELAATDVTSGVDRIEYHFGDGDWTSYDGSPVVFGEEGINTLHYRAMDQAGNIETARTTNIRVDTTAPTLAHSLAGQQGNAPWFVSPVDVELVGNDVHSGLDTIEYHLGDGDWSTYTGESISVDDEGVTTVHYRGTDVAGNMQDAQSAEVRIDTTPPGSAHQFSGEAGEDPWFVGPIEIELSADDAVSGVDRIEYHLGDDVWRTYAGAPVTFDDEGVSTLHYRAVDGAGNVESVQTADVHLDATAPTAAHALTGAQLNDPWFIEPVEVELTAADAISGVNRIEYHFGDGTWDTYPGAPVTFDGQGASTLHYRAVDQAGNVQDVQTHDIHIDTLAPSSTVALHGSPGGAPWFLGPVDAQITATDATSGVERIEYHLGDGQWSVYHEPVQVSTDGISTIHYRAVDQAGNVEPMRTSPIHIDTTPPEASVIDAPRLVDPRTDPYELLIDYSDNMAMNVSTIIENDAAIRVTGPDDFEAEATFHEIDIAMDGTPRFATYHLAAPDGGQWEIEHNGTYTIHLNEQQVADAAGHYAAAAPIGTFEVDVGMVVPLGANGASHLRYTDASGTDVTVRLTGNGDARLRLGGTDLRQGPGQGINASGENMRLGPLELIDTTARDSLIIRATGGDGIVELGSIVGDGSLARIVAPELVVSGDGLELDGSLGRLHVREIVDTDVRIAGDLGVLQTRRWDAGSLEADSLRLLHVTGGAGLEGDFGADVTLNGADNAPFTLTRAVVRGDLNSADWHVGGDARDIVVLGDVDDWTLNVDGDLRVLRTTGIVGSASVEADEMLRLSVPRWDTGMIEASSVRVLHITGRGTPSGDLGADVTLTGDSDASFTLTRAVVRGDITDADWNIAGDTSQIIVLGDVDDWSLSVDGDLRVLRLLGEVASADVQADDVLRLAAYGWDEGSITASTIRVLHIVGGLGADVTLTGDDDARFTLTRAVVRGEIVGGDWDVTGDARQIIALGAVDGWTLHVAGELRALTAHRDLDVELVADARIMRFVSRGDVTGSIDAASLGVLRVSQSLRDATLTLRAAEADEQVLDRLVVARWLDNLALHTSGSVGHVVAGGMRESRLLAGLHDVDAPPAALPASRAEFDEHFDALAHLRSVRLRGIGGESFALIDSDTVAGRIDRAVMRDVQADNAGEPFGLATLELGPSHGTEAEEDYVVRIL